MPSYLLVFSRTAFHSNGSMTETHTQARVLDSLETLSHSHAPTRQAQSPQSKLFSQPSPVCPGGGASAAGQGWPKRAPTGSTSKKATRSYMIHATASLSSGHHPLRPAVLPNSILSAYVSCLVAKKKGNGHQQWLTSPTCKGICVGISGMLQELTYAQAPPRIIRTKGDGGQAFGESLAQRKPGDIATAGASE